jgi:GT2 family glycosyltransferase/MoaA/NifB/PqqE/SkfB family radical SAM enzyme
VSGEPRLIDCDGMAGVAEFLAARTPRILWVELTSKCPFDCIFCSRQMRRGAGGHLPLAVYSSLLNSLVDPRKFILNYSGESSVYPDLIPAIQRARATGAFVEMVSAMATMPESLLGPLSQSGLNRLTVSVHATDPEKFAEIYRYSSFATLRSRLERFIELCRGAPGSKGAPPVVDLAFVAMDTNLTELSSVASLAGALELHNIAIFPVMRRDEIPAQFTSELTPRGMHRPEFEKRVQAAVNGTAQSHPEIRFTICNESFTAGDRRLGEVPIPYPWELPKGALIHSCEQNPWETAHVLSNGDVVACEVLDQIPLGNLVEQSIDEIWHGASYQRFRERYRRGEIPECRTCPWKRAWRPSPGASEIIAARGFSAQLLYGWHEPSGEDHIWSSQQAAAVLKPRPGSRTLHVSGMLPPGPENNPNQLTIRLNGAEIGRVTNPWEESIPFGLDFAVGANEQEPAGTAPLSWMLEFRTTHVYRPSERGAGSDQRDLGFALVLAVSKAFIDPERAKQQQAALQPLRRFVETIDFWGLKARRGWRRRPAARLGGTWKPGLSILIPEWDNAEELTACLASVREAACQWSEPLEVVVVVNGSPESDYGALRKAYPAVRWLFYDRPLGFGGAVGAGLRLARYDWVYLLNSDVVLEPPALGTLAPLRSGGTFSVASQIALKDITRFRDETNWTTLLVEAGLATIHDWIPRSDAPVPTFYGGGGASLFRTRLLRKLLDASAYDPFYWEDVEWGWRARKLGYESWYCPGSKAYHTRRSTIGRHYPAEVVESIMRRNGLLFQLRNFGTADSLERAMEEIARAPEPIGAFFLAPATRWKIARGRFWNHLAPFTDEEVFAVWNNSISNC